MCPVRALTFESLDLHTLFWHAGTSSGQEGKALKPPKGSRSKVKGQVPTSITKYTDVGGLPSTVSQSCLCSVFCEKNNASLWTVDDTPNGNTDFVPIEQHQSSFLAILLRV